MSESKQNLEIVHYQKGLYPICDEDRKASERRKMMEAKVAKIRRWMIFSGAQAFDISSEYPKYTVGRELEVQRVSLL